MNTKPLNRLSKLRVSIDLLDDALVTMLAERMRLIAEVALVKNHFGIDAAYSKNRENDLQNTFKKFNEAELPREFITQIYRKIYLAAVKQIKSTNDNHSVMNEKLGATPEPILDDLRHSIRNIDMIICYQLIERLRIVLKVKRYKQEHLLPPLDTARWQQLLQKKLELAESLGVEKNLVQDIFNLIHQQALLMQNSDD